MPHRVHLFSLNIGHALRESCFAGNYSAAKFRKDLLAGLTIGVIAIPLAMALAIASGVAPQYGIYTAIVGGFLIALTGGSRFSISGPTAAFVVILYPVSQQYGLGGLMLAGLMAGVILLLMAFLRLGRYIEYIPEPVTLGFTGGIAVVIATLQIKDLLGLPNAEMPEHYLDKVLLLAQHLPDVQWPSVAVGGTTLAIMLLWPRLKTPVPAHLPALLLGSIIAVMLNNYGFVVDTIDSRFSYLLADGSLGRGIPPLLPNFSWPWLQPGPDGTPLPINLALIQALLPEAFAIAMLCAIESLLCAVVLDGMSGTRHSANSELLGQGIGNIVVPFFGGITATAAIARSATNYKAGATSPVAAMVHALVVLLVLVGFSSLLGYLPMPAMAALLLVVAWNMSEAAKSVHLLRTSPAGDVWVFLTCFSLTVMLDMVIAVTVGILLASILFMKSIADMTRLQEITDNARYVDQPVPENWQVFKVTGPLFFAAADKVFSELMSKCAAGCGAIVSLESTTVLDAGGVTALSRLIEHCQRSGAKIVLTDVHFQPLRTMAKAKIAPIEGVFRLYPQLEDAVQAIRTDTIRLPETRHADGGLA